MRTKMVTAAVLSATGDTIAQRFLAGSVVPAFSVRRLLTIVAVNVGYIVPVLTAFYAANERLAKRLGLERAGWKKTGQKKKHQLF